MNLKTACSHSARLVLALSISVLIPNVIFAQAASDWLGFRGLSGGVVEELQVPVEWSNSNNVAWTADLAGGGLSSPIVIGDRIILTSAVGFAPPVSFSEGVRDMRPKRADAPLKFNVTCLNLADGKKMWEKTVTEARPENPIHGSNSFATESPASDGKNIFVYFAAVGAVACLDLEGNVVWDKNVGAYPTGNGFGTGSSIAVGEGMVFIQNDNDKRSFVAALNALTGDEVWKKDRSGRTSWATPLLWRNKDRVELVTCGSGFVTSYDPKSGDELWTLSGIGMSFSSSPAVDESRIYFGNSGPRSSGPLVAVSAGMNGQQQFSADQEIKNVDWSEMQAGPGMSSPVSVGGYLFVPKRGRLVVYKTDSGEIAYRTRLEMGTIAASLWAAGDKVFLLDEDGKTMVLEVGPELKVVAENQIQDDLFWSTPAVSGNSLLIRGVKKLYCIRSE